MSNTVDASAWIVRLGMAAASATVVGGGSMVLNLHRNDAVQDEKITQIQHTVQKIDTLDEKLGKTLQQIAVLNEQLKEERYGPRNK